MTVSTGKLRRLGAILGLTAAMAAIAAPASLANYDNVGVTEALKEIRNHPQSPSSVACDVVCRYLRNHEQGIRIITDTLGGNGGPQAQAAATSSRFSWSAAALGGATASVALVVLVSGTALVLRRRRSLAM
jgi:hypothetical protein